MRATLWFAGVALVTTTAVHIGAAGATRPTPPRLLTQTGLFVAGSTSVDPGNRPYSPQYPLWSDGAGKSRWVRLPQGATIDVTNLDDWRYPVGTKFWKEFAFNGRRVETRMLWRTPGGWVFASYVWNDAQTDARLAPSSGVRNVAELEGGRHHSIPSTDDCHACHEDGKVLGFNALQLSTDRDPLAPHAEPLAPGMVTLKTLSDEGRLRPARPQLVTSPPRIAAPTPRARAALGYLTSNCGTCHHEGAPIDTRLRLRAHGDGTPDDVVRTLLTAPVSWEIPSVDAGSTRFVVPGEPDRSSILARMRSRRPASQMPPLGTVIVDREAAVLLSGWIAEELPR